MDDLNRKRLEWMRDAKHGDQFPAELFNVKPGDWDGWGIAAAEAVKAALDEIDQLTEQVEQLHCEQTLAGELRGED